MASDLKEKTRQTGKDIKSVGNKELLNLLRQVAEDKLSDKEITTVTEFSKETNKIILPEGMSKLEASKELEKQHEEEETLYDAIKEFSAWHANDVLVAIKKATEKTFGWMHGVTKWTFFGPIRPKELEVQVDLKNGKAEFTQCFFGNFVITPWDEAEGVVNVNNGVCMIKLEVKKKYRQKINEYFREIENILHTESIYKGKCLKYEAGDFKFIEPIPNPTVILNEEEGRVVDDFIVRKLGRFDKYTALFTGPYGTGKTETAMMIGAKASEKGNTFIYCKNPEEFPKLLVAMRNYLPGCVFLEDVESIGGGENRDTKMNDLLNTLDGIETKGQQLLTIFTTNHEKKINKALRRPGRIDLIVSFGFCLPETVEKIYKKKFENLKGVEDLDWDRIVEATPHAQGAVIAAISDRAVDYVTYSEDQTVTTSIVLSSISSMKYQIEFMKEDPENTETREEKIVSNLTSAIADKVKEALDF